MWPKIIARRKKNLPGLFDNESTMRSQTRVLNMYRHYLYISWTNVFQDSLKRSFLQLEECWRFDKEEAAALAIKAAMEWKANAAIRYLICPLLGRGLLLTKHAPLPNIAGGAAASPTLLFMVLVSEVISRQRFDGFPCSSCVCFVWMCLKSLGGLVCFLYCKEKGCG